MEHTVSTNIIYNEDCYKGLQRIPDKSVDLIVTDPPYKFDTRGSGFRKKRDYYDEIAEKGMSNGIDTSLLAEFERVMKATNIYIFCNKNQLRMYFDFYKDKNCDLLVWHKTNPIPTINNKYLSDLEYIFFARDKGVRLGGGYNTLSKVFTTKVNKQDGKLYGHPTVKPLDIIKTLIYNSTKQSDIVLDPFMGSGTTAIAAIQLRRKYIGFEVSEQYYDTIQERIRQQNKQRTLF